MDVLAAAGAVAVRAFAVRFKDAASDDTGAVTGRTFAGCGLPIIAVMAVIIVFIGKIFSAVGTFPCQLYHLLKKFK